MFDDPNGTHISYDPGRTVTGPQVVPLGKIDVVLIGHMHSDYVDDRYTKRANASKCN